MTRRQSSGAGESLELLLDTICNTFGGVLFIAILLAISVRPESGSPESSLKPEELLTQSRAERLEAELESLKQDVAGLADQAAMMQTGADLSEDLAATEAARERAEEATSAARGTVDENEQAARRAQAEADAATAADEQASAEVVALEKQIARERKRHTELKTAIVEARDLQHPTISVPSVTRVSNKTDFCFVLEYGRLYVWHNHTGSGRRVNEADMKVGPLETARDENGLISLDENDEEVAVAPRPNAGIDLASDGAVRQVLDILAKHPRQRFTFILVVRHDSFGQYELVRNAIKSQQGRFRVFAGSETIRDHGGSGGPAQ